MDGDKYQLTVGNVATVAVNIFMLDTLATAEDNIGPGPTIDMMKRCFCATLFDCNYDEVTEEDFEHLDERLRQFVEDYPEEE